MRDHLLALQVWLPVQNDPSKGRYFTDTQRRAFYTRTLEAVEQVPGVRQVAQVTRLPMIYQAIGAFYPDMPLAQCTSNFDEAQTFYFEAMGGGDAEAWSMQMRASLEEIATTTPQFRSYISAGSEHCALPHDLFYTVEVNGRRLADWVRDMANAGPVENVSCTDCGAPAQ